MAVSAPSDFSQEELNKIYWFYKLFSDKVVIFDLS